MTAVALTPARSIRRAWYVLPLVLCAVAILLANSGVPLEPKAAAATTGNVNTTVTVDSTLTISDGCGSALALTVAMGGYTDAQCPITFGSSTDATVSLRAKGSTATFLSGGAFADETTNTTTCVALSGADEVGLKINAVTSANVTNQLCSALSSLGTNSNHRTVPDTFLPICTTATASVAHGCTVGVGVFEFGSNAVNGTYSGTLNLDVLN